MESLFKNPIIRNLLAIALGVVIIINPQLGPNIVIMLIGIIGTVFGNAFCIKYRCFNCVGKHHRRL